jgi:hypothetical protein
MKKYPGWICNFCGLAFGKASGISTFHQGKCDVCGREASVTEPRDYDYLNLPPEFENPKRDVPEFFKDIFK